MKPLKSLLCCLLAALIFTAVFPHTPKGLKAHAATARYARADARNIYFCERKDLNYALFTIPFTYCVEILSTDGEWYYVKYAEDAYLYKALYGYCLSENLTPVEAPPENIYLNMPVIVTFRTDTPVGSLPVLGEMNVTAAFYGTYYAGATAYSYVLYDGQFGYIYGANDNYPLNEIPEPEPPPEEIKDGGGGSNSKLITVLALTGLAVVTLIVLYFTSRKRYFKP